MTSSTTPSRGVLRGLRAFTLIELIVVILVLGILAAIAVVGYSQVTDRATQTAAKTELRQIAQAVLVKATSDSAAALDRDLVIAALEESLGVDVVDGASAAAQWTLLPAAEAPDAEHEVSVGFRTSATGAYTDAPGSEAVFMLGGGGHTYSQVVRWGGGASLGEFTQLDAGASPSSPDASSPFGAMWLWDNSMSRDEDGRGTGYAPANPQTIVSFARQQHLKTVNVSAPWVSDEGPIARWMDETTTALHDAGFNVGVLGGDPGWLDDPSLAATWATDAVSTRPVDHVQLDLEPWTLPAWDNDRAGTVAKWTATIDAVKASLPEGVELGMDAPFWLATTPAPGGGTLFDVLLERVDSVGIVTFVDNAEGADGILALSAPARTAAIAKHMPFTIGVETDSPAVAGGAEFTFGDDGADALLREATLVEEALAGQPLYGGIAVEHYRTWRSLLGLA